MTERTVSVYVDMPCDRDELRVFVYAYDDNHAEILGEGGWATVQEFEQVPPSFVVDGRKLHLDRPLRDALRGLYRAQRPGTPAWWPLREASDGTLSIVLKYVSA